MPAEGSPSRESAASHSLSSSSSSSGKSSGFVPSVANATVANLDAVVAAMAAGVVDANVDDRASHQSSPASYAGSGSIPVGASATSMARRGQWPGMDEFNAIIWVSLSLKLFYMTI